MFTTTLNLHLSNEFRQWDPEVTDLLATVSSALAAAAPTVHELVLYPGEAVKLTMTGTTNTPQNRAFAAAVRQMGFRCRGYNDRSNLGRNLCCFSWPAWKSNRIAGAGKQPELAHA
jgi:hypothetical protein